MVLVVLAGALFQLCSAQTNALDPGIGNEISFQLSGGFLIVIEGRIGSRKLKFILDTGATRSVVDRKVAGKLRPRRRAHVFSFDKTVSLEEADFRDVQFGPVQLSQFSMLVGDLSYFSEFARDADGLIGMDFLGRTNFVIDYEANKVRFSRIEGSASGFGSDPTWTCFTVEIRVQDRPVRLIVDTGLKGILLYEDRLQTSLDAKLQNESGFSSTTGHDYSKVCHLMSIHQQCAAADWQSSYRDRVRVHDRGGETGKSDSIVHSMKGSNRPTSGAVPTSEHAGRRRGKCG